MKLHMPPVCFPTCYKETLTAKSNSRNSPAQILEPAQVGVGARRASDERADRSHLPGLRAARGGGGAGGSAPAATWAQSTTEGPSAPSVVRRRPPEAETAQTTYYKNSTVV